MKSIVAVVGFFCLVGSTSAFLSTIVAMNSMLCVDGLQEMGDRLERCVDQIELTSKFDAVTKTCCPGLENAQTGAEFRKWFCEHGITEANKCGKCQEAALKKSGELEELKLLLEPLKDCSERAIEGI